MIFVFSVNFELSITIHVLLCYDIWSSQALQITVSSVRKGVLANLYKPFALYTLH